MMIRRWEMGMWPHHIVNSTSPDQVESTAEILPRLPGWGRRVPPHPGSKPGGCLAPPHQESYGVGQPSLELLRARDWIQLRQVSSWVTSRGRVGSGELGRGVAGVLGKGVGGTTSHSQQQCCAVVARRWVTHLLSECPPDPIRGPVHLFIRHSSILATS